MKFSELNLTESVQSGLNDVNFEEPTPVQEKSIPVVLEGKDIIATAQTGTGKTGAFVIPVMDRILRGDRDGIKCLILSPTRELAQQIDEEIFAIGYHTGLASATVIGGSDFSVQAKALKAGVDIIVATPGRLIDQKKIVNIDFSKLEWLVLDEADRMLDMGFLPDIKKIISWLPTKRQTLLFSATMPAEIEKLAAGIMKDPVNIDIARKKAPTQVEQRAYFIKSDQKIPLVKKIFKHVNWDSCIIFTSTKKGTDELQRLLKNEGIKAASIHGDRSQDERNRSLNAFKNGQVPVIVATNVIARGIDIKDVSMIINYDVPNNTDDYIHRIGRTGRYGKSGVAITFVTKRDARLFSDIDNIKGNSVEKIQLKESFGESSAFQWSSDDLNEAASVGSEAGKATTNESETGKVKTSESEAGRASGDKKQESSSESREESQSADKKREGKGRPGGKQKTNRQSGGKDSSGGKDNSASKSEDNTKRPDRRSKKKPSPEPEKKQASEGSENRQSSGDTDDKNQRKNGHKGKGGRSAEGKRQPHGEAGGKSRSGRDRGPGANGNGSRTSDQKSPTQSIKSDSGEKVESKVLKELVESAVIEKATERIRHIRKPAKGLWGVVKSFIPKIKPN